MPENILSNVSELGVAGVAILAIVYIVLTLSKSHQQERQNTETVFREFVQTNNHKITDLVVAATKAIEKSTESIEVSSKNITENTYMLREVREELLAARRA